MEMKLYEALYCSCIFESGYVTLSIHRTKEGAEKAIEWHRHEEEQKWKGVKEIDHEWVFGEHEDWSIREVEVLE
jgi:hypothetical protein